MDKKKAIKSGPKVNFTKEMEEALEFINNEERQNQTVKMLAAGFSHVFDIEVDRQDINRLREREAKRSAAERTAKKKALTKKFQPSSGKRKETTSEVAIQANSKPEAHVL